MGQSQSEEKETGYDLFQSMGLQLGEKEEGTATPFCNLTKWTKSRFQRIRIKTPVCRKTNTEKEDKPEPQRHHIHRPWGKGETSWEIMTARREEQKNLS